MRIVNTYNEFINEQIQVEPLLAGREGFKIYLKIVNNYGNDFAFQNYLNTGNYFYFFSTDKIDDINSLLDELKLKKSLETTYLTLRQIKDENVSFFIGIRDNILEYGFFNNTKKLVFKTGKFTISDRYLKYDFPRYHSVKSIKLRLKDANIKHLTLLHKIKKDLEKLWPNTESSIEIIDEFRIKKTISLDKFGETNQNEIKLTHALNDFARDKDWFKKVTTYVNIDTENNEIKFLMRILEDQITFFNFDPHL